MVLNLQPVPEALEVFCQRTGIASKRLGDMLERMAKNEVPKVSI
jgi:hypothetical protein